MPRRIGILGGTFDPPHAAHVRIVQSVLAAGLVDELLVIPAGDPWQKQDVSPATDRLAMARLAFVGIERCSVADLEVRRSGPTYAIDTLTALAGPDIELRYIVGADAFANLDTWTRIDEVVQICEFLVVGRPGSDIVAPAIPNLQWQQIPMPPINIASSDVRDALRAGAPRPRQLSDDVWRYIVEHRLYGVAHSTLRRPLLTTAIALLAAVAVLVSGTTLAARGVFFTRSATEPELASGWVAVGVRAPESAGGVVTAIPFGGPRVDVQPLELPAATAALSLNDVDGLEAAVGTSMQRPMTGAIIFDRLAFAGIVDGVDGIDVPAGHLDGMRAADYVLADATGQHLYVALRALLAALPTDQQKLSGLVRSLGSAMKSTDSASTVSQWLGFWQRRL